MNRACYSDGDDSGYPMALWRGAVKSAIKGKRGQAFLKEMLTALDTMPDKRLIAGVLVDGGQVCALGRVAVQRGVDVSGVDVYDWLKLSDIFGISEALVREIEYENDDSIGSIPGTDAGARRWDYMRKWVASQITSNAEPK